MRYEVFKFVLENEGKLQSAYLGSRIKGFRLASFIRTYKIGKVVNGISKALPILVFTDYMYSYYWFEYLSRIFDDNTYKIFVCKSTKPRRIDRLVRLRYFNTPKEVGDILTTNCDGSTTE